MNKRIVLVILIMILITGCFNSKDNKKSNELNNNNPIDIYTPIEEIPRYVDDNPITLGIYIDEGGKRKLITEYTSIYKTSTVMKNFLVFYTNEEFIGTALHRKVWKPYYEQYTDIDDYRIGYYIKFTLKNGEVIEQMILKPSDLKTYWNYVKSYLYDDIHQTGFYSHLTDDQMVEETIMTSIKLNGGKLIDEVVGPITLTAYSYNSPDDFDPATGLYRGCSSYTVLVSRK